ncbi:hypothetical protein RND81_08G134400 [Saponaria officinalis]|uniref:YDG domain-containing protein n=1 Tax=Saponaria officinalis TaxID=3572 RepID=A0AAW1J7J6_SAPOF
MEKSNNSKLLSNLSYGFESSSDFREKMKTKYVHYTGDFPSGFSSNVLEMSRVESTKELNDNWRRKVGAVKSKQGDKIVVKKQTNLNDEKAREKIFEILCLFREKCEEIMRKEGFVKRVDCRAMKELKNERKIIKGFNSKIGQIHGIKIGDKFKYRVELIIVGLHRFYEHGIDYMWHGNKKIATCIVAKEKHLDKMYNPNILIYIGEGGKPRGNKTGMPRDQNLKGGNLALWNSMEVKNPVRVVKGFKKDVFDRARNRMVSRTRYVYDGLYEVIDCEGKRGVFGNLIFEFKLLRCSEQPTVHRNG